MQNAAADQTKRAAAAEAQVREDQAKLEQDQAKARQEKLKAERPIYSRGRHDG